MDLTVDKLKVGAKLVLGKYDVQNDNPYPIVWLKATPTVILSRKTSSITSALTPESVRRSRVMLSITAILSFHFQTSSPF